MDSEEDDPSVVEFMRSLGEVNESSYDPAHQATVSIDDKTTRIVRQAVISTIRQPVREECIVDASRVQVNLSRIAFYEMDRWFSKIEDLTFKSVLLPIDTAHANVDAAIEKLGGQAFFKLSSVSAKDLCKNLPGERPNYSKLCVRSAKDVECLIKSSERLQHSLTQKRGELIVLREWIPNLDGRFEFRCFVCDGRVTGISQYEYVNVYPMWSDDKYCKTIFAEILLFLEEVVPRLLPLECRDWTVDVVKHADKWQVVEINAFGADLNVGGCLFHWRIDYELLFGSDAKEIPVIRFLSQSGIETGSGVFVVKQIKKE
jgi:hypothetical protein